MSTQPDRIAKFKVGEVAIWDSGKRPFAVLILEVITDDGNFYYRYTGRQALSEGMLRKQTELEKGNYCESIR